MFDTEKARKKYSLVRNLKTAFVEIKLLGIRYYAYLFLNVFSEVVIPFSLILIPTMVVAELQNGPDIKRLFIKIIIGIICVLLLNIIRSFTRQRMEKLGELVGTLGYWSKLHLYLLSCDIDEIEDSEKRNTLKGVTRTLYGGDGTGQYAGILGLYLFGVALIINIIGFLLYASVTSSLSVILLLVLFVASIISCIANSKAIEYEFSHMDKFWQNNGHFWYLKNEARDLTKAKDIRMYELKKWFSKSLVENTEDSIKIYSDIQTKYFYANYVVTIASFIRDLFAYVFLIWQLKEGQIDVATFVLYIGIVAGFSTWVSKIFESYSYLKKISNSLSVFRTFIDESEIKDTRQSSHFNKCNSIVFDNCAFSYGDHKVFKDFSLTIKENEKIALVGINGAGKTTLVKLLCGLYPLNEGKILFNGKDVSQINKESYYKNFSILFQDINVLPFSIAENIACAKENIEETGNNDTLENAFKKMKFDEGLHNVYDETKVIESIKQAGLWDKVETLTKGIETVISKTLDKDGIELSGGETQRLMLARALYKNAPVLILDEPTSALDPIAESELYEEYANLCKEKTSIYISHRLSSTRFCDRILFLENGEIVEEGTHDELMNLNGKYASMYQIQSHYYQKEELKDEAGI